MCPGIVIGIVLEMRMHGDAVGEHGLGEWRVTAIGPEPRGARSGWDRRRHGAGGDCRWLIARDQRQSQ